VGRAVHDLRHAGLPGISGRQARADLHGLGDSHPQHSGLEGAVLPDDRRALSTYREMLEKVDWEKYGVVDGVARDRVARTAWSIAATIPAAPWAPTIKRGDNWKNFKYNFSPRPGPRFPRGPGHAFNGFSIGKGHLAEARRR
jgi:hypothetical protein